MLKFSFLLLLFFMSDKQQAPRKSLNLKADDNGKQYLLIKEGRITLSLKAHISAGYSWNISQLDTTILKKAGEVKFIPESPKLGSPAIQLFNFQAINLGETSLKLIYQRSWEKEKVPKDSFEINIEIVK
jgi:predicted secreted protein